MWLVEDSVILDSIFQAILTFVSILIELKVEIYTQDFFI